MIAEQKPVEDLRPGTWHNRFATVPLNTWVVLIDSQGNTIVGRRVVDDIYSARSKRSKFRAVRKSIPPESISMWTPIG